MIYLNRVGSSRTQYIHIFIILSTHIADKLEKLIQSCFVNNRAVTTYGTGGGLWGLPLKTSCQKCCVRKKSCFVNRFF